MLIHIQYSLLMLLKLSIFFYVIGFTNISIGMEDEVSSCRLYEVDKPDFPWPHNNKKVILNPNNWMSLEKLSTIESKKIVWIDIRKKSERMLTPLNNAFNISMTELANVSFLKDSLVILVGDIFDQLSLDNDLNRLRQQGIKQIFPLSGGVRVWSKFFNIPFELSNEISPKDFLLGSKTIEWQVISFGLSEENIKNYQKK